MKPSPDQPSTARAAPPLVAPRAQSGRPTWRTGLWAHRLALAAYTIYAGRWGQYLAEARA